MKDFLQVLVVGVTLALVALLVVSPYRIHGSSMLQTYSSGDFILVDKLSYRFRDPKPGDVVVFNSPLGQPQVNRVVREVAPGSYWLEGDNKDESTDSRQFGPVNRTAIVGRVM